jgi:alpha-glucosidase
LDNYHGPYRSFTADHGDLDYYFIAGPRVDQVTRRFTWLTGRPAFPPKWGLGYSGSSMAYTDAPDAQSGMADFLDRCAEHDILCDSFHLSSGYTSIGDKRHVFHWNTSKFPDPAALAKDYLAKGVRICANIKPCLLRDHPHFAEAAALGLLIADAEGEPSWVQFWDGIGAYLDFTQPKTFDWWKAKVKEALLDRGIAATWNDNNEFEIWTGKALAHGFGEPRPARECKSLQTLLMVRASRDAQKEHVRDKRPFLVSRSGGVGMHRYVQTWSGDNSTSWETLKYNLKMGLGLTLSGISNTGHDIGGFTGPAPDPELLVRWVQFGVFMPRFSIHSWNDDGTVNAPWMHPKTTHVVRDLIKLRYRLIPSLYYLLWRYHHDYEPVVRPNFFDFPDDLHSWREGDEMMVGRSLLAAPVVEPGHVHREVCLPFGAHWYAIWSGEAFRGGQTITRPAPWTRPVLFARESCAIPIDVAA